MIRHDLPSGTIWEGDWLQAPLPGGYTMAEVDGPYALGKAAWDRMNIDGLAEWYAPHLARLTSLMLPSSTVYLWNTAEGWARLDPVMRGLGWTFESLVTWYKPNAQAQKATDGVRGWPDMTEVCGMYTRQGWARPGGAGQIIAYAAGESDRNEIRKWLYAERQRAGLRGEALEVAVNEAGGKGNMICRHSFTESQWCLPTFDQWKALHVAWNRRGLPEGRPYLQRSERGRVWDVECEADHEALRSEYEALRSEYEALRSEYEAARSPFVLPAGVTNLWTHPQVSGAERLIGPDGQALHPCQKPLLFAERMVQASTRPGDRVLVPFGGTCRIATYLERLRRMEPENARFHDTCELNADGKDYLGAVLGRMGEDSGKAGQMSLFGAR